MSPIKVISRVVKSSWKLQFTAHQSNDSYILAWRTPFFQLLPSSKSSMCFINSNSTSYRITYTHYLFIPLVTLCTDTEWFEWITTITVLHYTIWFTVLFCSSVVQFVHCNDGIHRFIIFNWFPWTRENEVNQNQKSACEYPSSNTHERCPPPETMGGAAARRSPPGRSLSFASLRKADWCQFCFGGWGGVDLKWDYWKIL